MDVFSVVAHAIKYYWLLRTYMCSVLQNRQISEKGIRNVTVCLKFIMITRCVESVNWNSHIMNWKYFKTHLIGIGKLNYNKSLASRHNYQSLLERVDLVHDKTTWIKEVFLCSLISRISYISRNGSVLLQGKIISKRYL